MASTFSQSWLLRRKIELVLPRLMAAGRAVMSHPQVAALYPDYLFTLHTMVRASVPLMETALKSCQRRPESDRLAGPMLTYFTQHIREERHHDEWLLEDLEALGVSPNQALARIPSTHVAAMVGSQYYWIEHFHPVALLGYIAVMEGYPPSPAQLEEQIAQTGLPRQAFRSLLKHAQLDPYHRRDLDELVDSLPLQPEHVKLLGLNAMHTINFASQAFEEILSRLPSLATAGNVPGNPG